MSFGELETLCDRVAGGLHTLGFGPGDRIAVAMPMTAESVAILSGDHQGRLRGGGHCRQLRRPPNRRSAADWGGQGVFTQDVILRGGARVAPVPALGRRRGPIDDCIAGARGGVDGNAAVRRSALGRIFCKPTLYRRPWACHPTRRDQCPVFIGHYRRSQGLPWTHVNPIKCGADGTFITKMSTQAMWSLGRPIWAG